MGIRGIHHLGVAVLDLDAALERYEQLFEATVEHRETIVEQGVEVISLRVGEGRLELLSALEADTPVGRFLDGRGPGMHHVAFEVDDVGEELARLRARGTSLVDERPRRGAFGLEIAFIHPDSTGGVLAELVAHA